MWGEREHASLLLNCGVCCMRGVLVKYNGCGFMHSVGDLGFIREHFKLHSGLYVRSVAKLA